MFLSRRYRPNKWPFFALIALESPLTVALLALFGIAAPDLYRTRLWQDGADNGFNSNPNAGLYAAANYKPYTTPKVWSQFLTDYNVVISVLSMFIMLTKSIMYICHVFPPILSVLVHAALIGLYAASVSYQSGSDTSDPAHPQHGAPWYITKSCSVAHDKNNVHYCEQAKAAFACTCVMLGVFVAYFGFAFWSCFPSNAHQLEYSEKQQARAARAEKYAVLNSPLSRQDGYGVVPATPFTPGIPTNNHLNPMTPRTLAFNRLGGTTDLPLRKHFSSPNAPKSPTFSHDLGNMDNPRNPSSSGFEPAAAKFDEEAAQTQAPMYFPPPPKQSTKK